MAFGNIGAYTCQNLQVDLIDYYGKNSPEFRTMGSVSLIKWLLSPQNTSGFKQIDVESIPGKKRGVAFMVEDPYCFDVAKLDVDCETVRVNRDPASKEVVFDLDSDPFRVNGTGNAPEKLRFSEDDMARYCTREDQSWMKKQIFKYLMQFEKALDKALTTSLATFVPAEWTKTTPLFVKNTTTGGAVLNPEGAWSLNQFYNDIGMDGNYGIIGGQIVNKMAQFQKWLCCNNAGVDMSKQDASTPWAFYDRNFDTTFGVNELLIMAPGTVQLVTWNKYKGEKKKAVTDLYTNGTIVMPGTGLVVDYQWRYDYDCGIWTFEAFLHAELAVVPAGGCTGVETANGLIQVTDCGLTTVIPECPAP